MGSGRRAAVGRRRAHGGGGRAARGRAAAGRVPAAQPRRHPLAASRSAALRD